MTPDEKRSAVAHAVGAHLSVRRVARGDLLPNDPRYDEMRHTLYEVLCTARSACAMGYTRGSVHTGTHDGFLAYNRCEGGKCPSCLMHYLSDVVERLLLLKFPDIPADGYLFRTVLPNYDVWRMLSKRGKVKGAWWVRTNEGAVHVYATEPGNGAELVPAVPAVLDSLLQCTRSPGKGNSRHAGLPRFEYERDPEKFYFSTVTAVTPESVIEDYEQHGGTSPWHRVANPRATASFARAYEASLSPADAERIYHLGESYNAQRERELEEMQERRRERKRVIADWQEFAKRYPDSWLVRGTIPST